MQSTPKRQRRSPAELATELSLLAFEARAANLGNDARRVGASDTVALLQLCLRLRHHLHELHRAIGRPRVQTRARLKAVTLTRAAIEQQLDRTAHDAARAQLSGALALARTKFVMSSKVDAFAELALRLQTTESRRPRVDHASEIARSHLAGLWVRLADHVHAPVLAFSARLCSDVETALAELGEGILPEAMIDVLPPPLGTFDEEMAGRLRLLGCDLETLLVGGSAALVQRLLDYYDDSVCSLDATLRERLDSIEATLVVALGFADEPGTEVSSRALARVLAWSARLALLVEDLA